MRNPSLLLLVLLSLLLSILVPETTYSQDWPHFWPARFDFLAGHLPWSVAVGDFDEDGHQDLAVANWYSDDVAILLGNWKEVGVEIDCATDTITQGESLPFALALGNKTDSTVTCTATLKVKRVGGLEKPSFFGPFEMTLQGGQEITRSPSIEVPNSTLVGDYILTIKAKSLTGDLIDEDSFRVTVIETNHLGIYTEGNFILNGW